jgi:hypothetical protein
MAWQLKKQVDRLEREVEQLKAKFNPPPPPPRKGGEESAGVSIYSITSSQEGLPIEAEKLVGGSSSFVRLPSQTKFPDSPGFSGKISTV